MLVSTHVTHDICIVPSSKGIVFLLGDHKVSCFTLTPTLTTDPPINRAFQTNCEGVRVEKEKSFFILSACSRKSHVCKMYVMVNKQVVCPKLSTNLKN